MAPDEIAEKALIEASRWQRMVWARQLAQHLPDDEKPRGGFDGPYPDNIHRLTEVR